MSCGLLGEEGIAAFCVSNVAVKLRIGLHSGRFILVHYDIFLFLYGFCVFSCEFLPVVVYMLVLVTIDYFLENVWSLLLQRCYFGCEVGADFLYWH